MTDQRYKKERGSMQESRRQDIAVRKTGRAVAMILIPITNIVW